MTFHEAIISILAEMQIALDQDKMQEYERLSHILSGAFIGTEIQNGKVLTKQVNVPKGAEICPNFMAIEEYRLEKENQ